MYIILPYSPGLSTPYVFNAIYILKRPLKRGAFSILLCLDLVRFIVFFRFLSCFVLVI